ncbi:hypothetical protein CHARACLAT_013675 [Characodon lateralis]|uniref:Uncharacterized protein n=1 Tax=Characodon lateralis TaxID=208331 RepID=A0ABU7D775_9TELE|nr:hypothetical protein [Characodon lateralis]
MMMGGGVLLTRGGGDSVLAETTACLCESGASLRLSSRLCFKSYRWRERMDEWRRGDGGNPASGFHPGSAVQYLDALRAAELALFQTGATLSSLSSCLPATATWEHL